MRITEIMHKRTAFSFELFPPKTEKGEHSLLSPGGVLDRLCALQPDYISCTYGAGGSNVGKQVPVLDAVRKHGVAPVAHITCVGSSRDELRAQLQSYLDHGVDSILALRGDLPAGWTGTGGDLRYASELVRFVRREFGGRFTVAVAGSPEGHIACRSIEADVAFLRQKQDEGADYIMTQLCWDMDQFRRWLEMIRRAGITLPVDVGIMPVLDAASTINMALSRNGCAIPRELARIISRHWVFPSPFAPGESDSALAAQKAAFKEAGLEYTVRLIDQYRACGIDGIHLYALNKYDDVARLVKQAGIMDI